MFLSPTLSPTPSGGARRSRFVLRAAAVVAASAAMVVSSAAVANATPQTPSATASAVPAGRYNAISPTRVLDTRTTGTPFHNGDNRTVDLSAAFTPAASAVVLNLTAVGGTGSGFLAAYPAGTAVPNTSSLNFVAGDVRSNSVTVAVGSGSSANQVAIHSLVGNSGSVQVLVDVVGYYGAGGGAAGTSYQPLGTPVRMFDTRNSIGPLTLTYPKNIGIVAIDYGSPAVNRTISAVAMNITVTDPAAAGYVAVWDGFGPTPKTSTVNFDQGQTVANMAIAPVRCTDASCNSVTFSILNAASPSTQVIGDIAGAYMTPSTAGLLFTPMAPRRVTDTRTSTPFSSLGANSTGATPLAGTVPSTASAVVVNLTVVTPTAGTYLSLYPTGVGRPVVSSINANPGDIVANAAQVRLGSGGFTSYNFTGSTDLVIDLAGTFSRDTSGSFTAATATAPAAVNATVSSS